MTKKKPKLLSSAKASKHLAAYVSGKTATSDKERQMIYISQDLRQEVHVWSTAHKRSFSDVAVTALREYMAKNA